MWSDRHQVYDVFNYHAPYTSVAVILLLVGELTYYAFIYLV